LEFLIIGVSAIPLLDTGPVSRTRSFDLYTEIGISIDKTKGIIGIYDDVEVLIFVCKASVLNKWRTRFCAPGKIINAQIAIRIDQLHHGGSRKHDVWNY
jgi:hypothetical protein